MHQLVYKWKFMSGFVPNELVLWNNESGSMGDLDGMMNIESRVRRGEFIEKIAGENSVSL
jgi:hypothetical protein